MHAGIALTHTLRHMKGVVGHSLCDRTGPALGQNKAGSSGLPRGGRDAPEAEAPRLRTLNQTAKKTTVNEHIQTPD